MTWRSGGVAGLLLILYLLILAPFTSYLRNKPIVEKLGYTPQAELLRLISADQKQSLAAGLVLKVLIYFGSLVEINKNKIVIPPDYFGMYKTMETAVKLDPYNLDSYYFTQAIIAWDMKKIKEANSLLEYGMRYRDWDFYLPFFAGFNYAYFLKDYTKAAQYYKLAGKLSGAELYQGLAGRYMQEAGQTDLAIGYLATMEKGAKNEAIRKTFRTRLKAFREIKRIEVASADFQKIHARRPVKMEELLSGGFLKALPVDPYGGEFYLDADGRVRTTSKLAFPVKMEQEKK
jgi:tetratricopeptide (TPR) repeat protein